MPFYFLSKKVYLFAETYGEVSVIKADKITPNYYPVYTADWIKHSIDSIYSKDSSALLTALLTGDRSKLSSSDTHAFSRAGLSHVVAISGMHISILSGLLLFLFGTARVRTLVLHLSCLLFFVCMTGASPGTVRAFILSSIALFAPLVNRKPHPLNSLCLALCLLLLYNPFSIANVGLQFSFLATLGIFTVSMPLYKRWKSRFPNPYLQAVLSILAVSIGASLLTLPLSAYYFNQVSLLAPLSNLCTLWSISLAFILGITSVFLYSFFPPLAMPFVFIVEHVSSFFFAFARALEKIPFISFALSSLYALLFFVFFYLLIILCSIAYRKGTYRVLLPVYSCVFCFFLFIVLSNLRISSKPLTIHVLDVGQGQSVLLTSYKHRALVDCGGNEKAGMITADYLHSIGWTSLDVLALTHYHDDHMNGLPDLMSRISIGAIFLPDTDHDSQARLEVERLAKSHGTDIFYIHETLDCPLGDANLRIYPPVFLEGDNEDGLSVLFTLDGWETLITGDMSAQTEKDLIEQHTLPDIELLILGHHGSAHSTSTKLLETTTPDFAVASVGKNNTYGHPSEETLEKLEYWNIPLYRTDLMNIFYLLSIQRSTKPMSSKSKQVDNSAYKSLKKDIQEQSIKQLYIFHGVEHYLRDHYLEQMKTKLLPSGMESFNYHTLDEKNFSVNKLSERIDSLPMMSERTLIVVSDYDLFKAKEEDRRAISELISNLPDYCCLVFLYDLIAYKSDGRMKHLATAIKTHANVVNFARQNTNDLSDWINRRFQSLQHTISRSDAQYLIFLCGDLMTGLISEIEKIGAYAKQTQVTRADIDAVAIPQLDAVVFQMTDALAKNDFQTASKVLGDLLSMQEEPIMIVAVLGKHFRQLLSARLAFSDGRDAQYLMKLWDMRSSYPAQKMMTACRHFSVSWYRRAIVLCYETDLNMKSVAGTNASEALISLLLTLSVEDKPS